jgi:capsular exopolysaccharide synthesis family protein
MSNIFDALRRGGHELAGIDLPDLLDDRRQPAFPPGETAPPEPDPASKGASSGVSSGFANGAANGAANGDAVRDGAPAAANEHRSGHIGLSLKPGGIRTRPIAVRTTGPILPFDEPRNTIEQYRMLRTKIQQHPANPQVLLISGSGPGDGKTTNATNLAGVLSMKRHTSVVLVDGDFRRSSVRKVLGLQEGPGLVDILTGACSLDEALIRTEQYPNLYVLGSGQPCENSAELLDSPRWMAILDALRKEFTYVVLDSPPIGSLADYDLLQAGADGVILVIRPDHTRRELAMRALNSIPKEKFLGVVMNCVDKWFLKKDYYGYAQEYYVLPDGNGKK